MALALVAALVTGIQDANALEKGSVAAFCPTSGPQGTQTRVCSYSYTTATAFEVFVLSADSVEVTGVFVGPGYDVERFAESNILFFLPSTWQAKVQVAGICAYSGLHTASGTHVGWTEVDIPPVVDMPFGNSQSYSENFRAYCDCNSEIP